MFRFGLCLLLISLTRLAAAGPLTVHDAWVRGLAKGQSVTPVYMVLQSDSAALITGVTSSAAARVELREMAMEDKGPLKPKLVDSFLLSAKEPFRLSPVGAHLMLIGVKQPLQPGERVPLILEYTLPGEKHGTLKVEAVVRPFYR
jgi:periplasmic copper chaperone A